ncbi:PaaI family thioesterase [Profundibacterium mesophilum]|uniref:Thioesterase superfamily domain containing protein n=1 Tax=Profundibacterium mesophilum KAUST100406-0324 TaxID=1037889 RepID=A0A921NUH0_9RHOB|nr:PaaI family thioesterase [Profundibacterium mesophilum]KAF0676879.1 Thioesterase superfamily domain containing protein [Profundibacterium mesophilum KAUST100406-0324]
MAAQGIIEGETGTQRLLGYVLDVGGGDGMARCRLTLTGDHTNRHGRLHGGIAVSMLDNAMGAAGSLSVDETGMAPFLTISLTTNFLASAQIGDALTATGWITGGGRSVKFIAGELVHENGTLIATASGVFKPVPPGRVTPAPGDAEGRS